MKSKGWTLLCLYYLWNWANAQVIGIDAIINQYKKNTLKLREDVYQNNLPILDSYDYVIVGAGPSGCVLANRLTEDPKVSVLLLEAGPETTEYNHVPFFHLLFFDTEYNWKFVSQNNPRVCGAMEQKRCTWPSGRGIGGGTVINGLLFTRGNKRDFDSWAEEGNDGWSYNDILQYFKKLENTREPNLRVSPLRGTDGPLWVSYAPYKTNASLVFEKALQELGYPQIDYNTPYTSGYGKMQLSLKNGERSSSSRAYLFPAHKRPNLHIVQRAQVSKVLIEPQTKTAFGVEFFKKGIKREVKAKQEVILSAGAFGSPKILMLSGIGPKKHLESLNIPLIQDLPVGKNLQEHIGLSTVTFLADYNPSFIPDYWGPKGIAKLTFDFLQHRIVRKGQLTYSGIETFAYVSSRYANDTNPDIELLFAPTSLAIDYGYLIRKTIGIRDDVYNSYLKPLEEKTTMSILIMGCYPKSRGSIRLASKNPFDDPVINNNFLDNEEDFNVIVDGIKKAISISETRIMKSYGVRLYDKILPGCENFIFGTDDYWKCTVRQITHQYHHQSGTCRMGKSTDPRSVVDSSLRVHGVQRLRVVDVSIMPTITAGHTQAPAYMIGEKAADMIKENYARK